MKTSCLTVLVVSLEVSLSLLSFGLGFLLKVIKFFIFLMDSIDQPLVLLNVSGSSLLDGFEQLLIFGFDSLLLHLMLLNKLLHFAGLYFKIIELLNILVVVLLHLLL